MQAHRCSHGWRCTEPGLKVTPVFHRLPPSPQNMRQRAGSKFVDSLPHLCWWQLDRGKLADFRAEGLC